MDLKLMTSPTFRDTHTEKAPSNRTLVPTKGMNMEIWVVGTSNSLKKVLILKQFFQKK